MYPNVNLFAEPRPLYRAAKHKSDIPAQSKLYDKIVKENMQKVLPVLVKDILDLNIVAQEDLQESLQHTTETIPDQLSKVTDSNGNTYILHIEWQSENDSSMDNRMLSYRAMLRRKHKLAVKQYVIFLAREKSVMPHTIDEENLKFSYNLIALRRYSYKTFLKSPVPEQKLLAVFGDFEQESPESVITQILNGIENEADGELNRLRYREQLRALIQLRKLGKQFKTAMGTITTFKVENDPFYQDGIKQGVKEGVKQGVFKKNHDFVENLIIKLGLSDEQVADIAEVSVAFVKKVREELNIKKTQKGR